MIEKIHEKKLAVIPFSRDHRLHSGQLPFFVGRDGCTSAVSFAAASSAGPFPSTHSLVGKECIFGMITYIQAYVQLFFPQKHYNVGISPT